MSVLRPSRADRVAATAEGRLQPSAQAAAVFEQAPVGLATLDLTGLVTDINPIFLDILGADREDVLARPFVDHVAEHRREDVNRRLAKLVLGSGRSARLEAVPLIGAEQRPREVALDASGLMHDGDNFGLILTAHETVRQHLDASAISLQAQKMQAVGQLAGGIAHDFNNLLTAMIGFSDLLLARHRQGDPSHEDVMQIRRNALSAAALVRQLLAFSRQQSLTPVVVNPAAAIRELALMLSRLLGPTIALRLREDGEQAFVRVDAAQFDQVIVNLAVNARDAMPDGGVLTIRSGPHRLDSPREVGSEVIPAGDYVRIEVADTGSGIEADVLSSIFEPFFTTKAVGEGTGLGLSTVYGIVRQSDGFIAVESTRGRGTRFSIYLPPAPADEYRISVPAATIANPQPDPPPPADLEPAREPAGMKTILLVDDEPGVRAFTAKALQRAGYRVLDAGDGEEALALVHDGAETIDLLVSDVVMPGMDGYTLVRLLEERPNGFAVIMMSGYAEDVLGGARAHNHHFLMKPFTLSALIYKVGEALSVATDRAGAS